MADQPEHLGTSVQSGNLDEKKDYGAGAGSNGDEKLPPTKEAAPADEEEEEDEDIDALIEELESQDANIDADDEEAVQPGGARVVPEEMLQTSTRTGLNANEVLVRRKKYGLNQMKEEKENLILKFLGFFVGPIQFVMEVSGPHPPITVRLLADTVGRRRTCCRSYGLGRLWRHLCPASPQRCCRFHPGVPSRFHRRRAEEDPRSQGYCSP